MKDFLIKLYSETIKFLGNIRLYPLGLVLLGKTSYDIKGEDMRRVLDIIEPGDVLLRSYTNYLSSMFIPGHDHAALYIGDGRLAHAVTSGLESIDILSFLRGDKLTVVRSRDNISSVAAVKNAKEKLELDKVNNIGYDFIFNSKTPEKFYCSEFVDFCYGYPLRKKKGNDSIIYPSDFIYHNNFKIVWEKK